jgi:4-hydroxy-tetrahydrodipicolinate reductase
MKPLIIVGRIGINEAGVQKGEMAKMLLEQCKNNGIHHILVEGAPFPNTIYTNDSVVVYVSSKERFSSVFEECQKLKLPLIVASSGIKDIPEGTYTVTTLTAPVIMAPNLALIIQALFDVLPRFAQLAKLVQPLSAEIAEGHQASKTSAPITAQKIADMFNVPHDQIGHVRSDSIAKSMLGIPQQFVGGFGAHFLEISAGGVDVVIRFRTLGRVCYFSGLRVVLEAMEKNPLKPGVYEAHKLVFPPHPLQLELDKLRSEYRSVKDALDERMN